MAVKRYNKPKRGIIGRIVRSAGKAAKRFGGAFGAPGRILGGVINSVSKTVVPRTKQQKLHKRLYKSGITGRLTTGTQGGSTSYFTITRYPNMNKSVMKNLTASQTMECSYPLIIESQVGQQAAGTFYLFDGVPVTSMFQFYAVNFPSVPINSSSKLLLEGVTGSIEYVNSSTAPAHFKLYDLAVKRDLSSLNSASTFPELAWNQGEIDQGDPAGSSNIMSYPTRSERFNTFWKIINRRSMVLSPGECHTHTIKLQLNRWITQADAVNSVRWRNLTYCVMASTYGTPADASGNTVADSPYDASGNFTGSSLVTTTSSQINAVMRLRYKYRILLANNANIDVLANIAQLSDLEVVNSEGMKISATTT